MATTPNYGWVMPDPTDFVTDLPADFEIFGDAVDATVDGIETIANAAQPNVITTEGDLVVGDASGDPVRVPVGTVGQILASDGDTVEWITPAVSGSDSYTLLNAGGTSLSGVATVTISGISNVNTLLIIYRDAGESAANRQFQVRINGDTGTNYDNTVRSIWQPRLTFDVAAFNVSTNTDQTNILVAQTSNIADAKAHGFIKIEGCNGSGVKPYYYSGGGANDGNAFQLMITGAGIYDSASTISSITFRTSAGTNFNSGTIFVYATS